MKMVDKAWRPSLYFIGNSFFFIKRDILALLKLSNCPSTLACHKVSHLSIKDTLNHTEHCVYLNSILILESFLLKLNGWQKWKVAPAAVWNNHMLMTTFIPPLMYTVHICIPQVNKKADCTIHIWERFQHQLQIFYFFFGLFLQRCQSTFNQIFMSSILLSVSSPFVYTTV